MSLAVSGKDRAHRLLRPADRGGRRHGHAGRRHCRRRLPDALAGFLFPGVGHDDASCVPCVLLFLATPFPAAWALVFIAEFFLFFNTGPTNTVLANVVHPAIRSTGFAVNILVIDHVRRRDFAAADRRGWRTARQARHGLSVGFVVVSFFIFLSGVFWLWAAAFGSRHRRRPAAIELDDGAMNVKPASCEAASDIGCQRRYGPHDAVVGLLSESPNPQIPKSPNP